MIESLEKFGFSGIFHFFKLLLQLQIIFLHPVIVPFSALQDVFVSLFENRIQQITSSFFLFLLKIKSVSFKLKSDEMKPESLRLQLLLQYTKTLFHKTKSFSLYLLQSFDVQMDLQSSLTFELVLFESTKYLMIRDKRKPLIEHIEAPNTRFVCKTSYY